MLCPTDIPLALYIHLPWCVKKCPYCDFNSHTFNQAIPEADYIQALVSDLIADKDLIANREIKTIFIGGGTPSLFSGDAIKSLFEQINQMIPINSNAEITMEANPGTIDIKNFIGYRQAGVNRLSLGIQSFNPEHLKKLGRIHSDNEAKKAISFARKAGFENINLDLMFGLPNQSLQQGLQDLKTAIEFEPEHISWYQLTLEPNTVFHKYPPPLPLDDDIADLHQYGQELLQQHGFSQYEISAYAKANKQCLHNLNYWQFGDYLGIGAGAHGKITLPEPCKILRREKLKLPRAYMTQFFDGKKDKTLSKQDIIFEFMLNTLRLYQPLKFSLFTQRTGLDMKDLLPYLDLAQKQSFIELDKTQMKILPQGRRYLNDLLELFLPT